MDVSQFVKDVLVQVAKGVEEAKLTNAFHAVGTTNFTKVASGLGPNLIQDLQGRFYTVVDFDMAVTVVNEIGGSGGLKIPFFDATAQGKHTGETVSRVKFSLPISFNSYTTL